MSWNVIESTQDEVRQIDWLRTIFKTDNCKKIKERLSNISSFGELFPKDYKANSKYRYQRIELRPSELATNDSELVYDHLELWKNVKTSFGSLKLFKEFNNLNHYYFTNQDKRNICHLIQEIPSIKSITISQSSLKSQDVECITLNSIKLYLSGDFKAVFEKKDSAFFDLVYGIENYEGELRQLQIFKNLRYLGIKEYQPSTNLKDLVLLPKLINLYVNLKNVAAIEEIRFIRNLQYLTLNCIDKEPGTFDPDTDPDKCHNQKISQIDFLSKLPFLKGLDLSWNSISDLSAINNLKALRYINVGMNQIIKFPNFRNLRSLEKVILSFNHINSIDPDLPIDIDFELDGNPINKLDNVSCPKLSQNRSINKFCKSE